MASLTVCLQKVGAKLDPADKAAVMARSRELRTLAKERGEPMSATDAAIQAAKDVIAEIRAELKAAEPAQPAQRKSSHPKTVMGAELLALVSARLGGLDPAWLPEFSTRFATGKKTKDGAPQIQWRNPPIPGVGLLFRRGGTQDLSAIAQMLEEADYLESGSTERDYKEAGERAKDMIRAALNRDTPKTLSQQQAEMEAGQEAERKAYYDALDEESAAEADAERAAIMAEAGMSRLEIGAVDDDDLFNMAGTTDTATQMRAMGFTEQEIADELAREAQVAAAAAQASAGQDAQVGPEAAPADGPAGVAAAQRGSEPAEGLTLEAQTPEALKAKATREKAAADADAKEQKRLAAKAKADAEVTDFRLEGSDRPADVAAAAGQGDIFDQPSGGPQQGKIGGKMAAGEVVLTASGRETTPFPKVSLDTNRKATATVKAVDQWLMRNALAEAEARGDEFNARMFRANMDKPQQADKDSAEEYLFGQQPDVPPPFTKPLSRFADNKVFTQSDVDAARALLKKKLGQLNSGIDPELMQAGITIAGAYIESGVRKFADFARVMVDDLGERVKPYLQSWYMAVRADPRAAAFRAEMDKASAIEDLDVDEVLAAPKAEPAPEPATPAEPAVAAPMPAVGGISMALAEQAHRGTSFTPERRAEQERDSFLGALREAWDRAARIAGQDQAAIDRITEVFKDVADGYRERYTATLQARSRVMSSMIAGPARFPVDRNRKRLETEQKRAEEAHQYLGRGIKRLLRAARGPIDNSPESELERVRLNLTQREEAQEQMKAANVALRKGDDAALEDLGFTAEQIAGLKKPDFAGRTGFPDYKLTNNNAEIRRLRERLKSAEDRMAEAAAGPVETERQGVRMVEDATDDRLRLIFDGKPDEEVRNDLKANGFRWSPKNEAWQRQLTDNARAAAKQVLNKHYPPEDGQPVLSQTPTLKQGPGRGVPLSTLKPHIDALAAKMPGLRRKPTVVADVYDLPPNVLAGLLSQNAEGNVRALLMPSTGDIYLVASRLDSLAEAEAAFFHESYGHEGMRAILTGEEYARAMTLLKLANKSLADDAARWMSDFGRGNIKARVDSGMSPEQALQATRLLSIEEALADRAGKNEPPKMWKTVMAIFQKALRRLDTKWSRDFANWLENRTEAETYALLMQARKAITEGRVHALKTLPAGMAAMSRRFSSLKGMRPTQSYVDATPRQQATLDRIDEGPESTDYDLLPAKEDLNVSADAHFTDWEQERGIKYVPLEMLGPLTGYNNAKDTARIRRLADAIQSSNTFEPIFVGIDPNGEAYIMEGQHRARALEMLGQTHVPAQVIVSMEGSEADYDALPDAPVRAPTDYRAAAGQMPLFSKRPPPLAPAVTVQPDENGNPEFAGDGVVLAYPQPAERFEFIPGPGQRLLNYAIMPAEGFDSMGFVDLVVENGRVTSLMDIEVNGAGRRAGVGRKVIETILAANPEADVNISNIVHQARGFWAKMGVPEQNLEDGAAYDGTLNWQAYAQAANDGRAAQVGQGMRGEAGADDRGRQGADRRPASGAQAPVLSQRDPTQTPAFKAWFGDSKVVDAQGNPLRVYHGTHRDFSTFDAKAPSSHIPLPGFYFTPDPGIASMFAESGAKMAENNAGRAYEPVGAAVMPAYLSVQNPLDFDASEGVMKGFVSEKIIKEIILEAKRKGHDGVVIRGWRDGSGPVQYVAFRPEQIKSAIGNAGTFDPSSPSILLSQKPKTEAGWAMPDGSKFDDFVWKFQNKNIDLLRSIGAIKQTFGDIADRVDAYLQEELFHGRAAKRTHDFVQRELEPLLADMKAKGIGTAQLDLYLHARHAEEANKVIAERNKDPNEGQMDLDGKVIKSPLQDGGSGMLTKTARDYLAGKEVEIDGKKVKGPTGEGLKALQEVAAKVDRIIDTTRAVYVNTGLESKATIAGWESMFKHYVPLFREDAEGGGMGIGQGYSIKGPEAKHRTGSTAKVVDILANIALAREKAIVRAEKNRVAVALAGLVKANPNPDVWSFGPVSERRFNEQSGLVEVKIKGNWKSADNVLVAKIPDRDGNIQEVGVVFNDKDERALRMATALKNLDAARLEGVLAMSAKLTRWFAAINTQYNPIFGFVNLVRDVGGAAINLESTPLKDKRAAVMKNIPAALWAVGRVEAGGTPGNKAMAALWEEMQNEGGMTGFRDLYRNSQDRAAEIEFVLNPTAWMDSKLGKFITAGGVLKVPEAVLQKGATKLFRGLSHYNTAMEAATRLSVYKVALEQGLSKQRAASLAKNITVNFNRKGQVGLQAGALYAFFNAAMQGTARMGEVLFDTKSGQGLKLTPAAYKIITGSLVLGGLQAVALAMAGFDEDEPPQFVRERNLIIPTGWLTGKRDYVTIPMPLGWHVLPNIGRMTTEYAMSGFEKGGKRAWDFVGMLADAFNPMGNAGLSWQTIAPTALGPIPTDIVVAMLENRDWTGKPIARRVFDKAAAGWKSAKDTASTHATFIARALNHILQGTDHQGNKVWNATPDQIDYLIGQAFGGVARELGKIDTTLSATISGEELPPHKIPLVGRFYGNAEAGSVQASRFYDAMDRFDYHQVELKGLAADWIRKHGPHANIDDSPDIKAYRAKNPEVGMLLASKAAERQVQMLRKEKSLMIKDGKPRADVKQQEAKITEAMRKFNEALKSSRAQQLEALQE